MGASILKGKTEKERKGMFFDFKTNIAILFCGFILDLIIGDPRWMPHPVKLMGKYISSGERILRKIFPDNRWGHVLGGMILTITLVVLALVVPLGIIWVFNLLNPMIFEKTGWIVNAGVIVSIFMCWQTIAGKDLKKETMAVYKSLADGDLPQARKNLSMVVGRDTLYLSEPAVSRAGVETVAENTSDGVIAPMFYFALGGAPLAMAYKGINTLDSMIGYKNEKYFFFGRYAAILDDIANFIPARITGILMIITSFFLKFNCKEAWRILKRDRKQHTSPNSGIPEAACAGALMVRLGGLSTYNLRPVDKPYIGDDTVKINREHIKDANKLMLGTAWLLMIILIVVAKCI